MTDITLVVPVYNESETLKHCIDALVDYINSSSKTIVVQFINDGSTDNSLELLEEFTKDYDFISVLHFDKNYGLSSALKAGFDNATSAWVAYLDADLQTHPQDFERLYPFMNHFDLITGIRTQRHDNLCKQWSSKFANWYRNLFTKDGIKDTGCPLKLIKTDYAKKLLLFKGMHRFLPALIQLLGGKVKQVPISHYPRQAGASKFNIWNRALRGFIDCWVFLWMRKRYIRFNIKKDSTR